MFGFEVKKTLEKQLKASKGFSHKFSGDNFPTIFQTPVPVMVESESAGTSSFPASALISSWLLVTTVAFGLFLPVLLRRCCPDGSNFPGDDGEQGHRSCRTPSSPTATSRHRRRDDGFGGTGVFVLFLFVGHFSIFTWF